MMSTTSRPTRCAFCEQFLYYFEDPKHVPEFVIEIRDPKKAIELNHKTIKFFVHQHCWNTLLMYPKHIWKQDHDIESIDSK